MGFGFIRDMKTKPSKHAGRKPYPSHRASTIPGDLPAPICRALADEIREQREARNLSCYAVAKLSHLAKETVCLVERKRYIHKIDTAARISDVFGMKFALLVVRAARRC